MGGLRRRRRGGRRRRCAGAGRGSPVTTQPAAWAMAMGAAKCTLSRRSPSWTYAARRPAASQVSASVVELTRGLNSRWNVRVAEEAEGGAAAGVVEVDVHQQRGRHEGLSGVSEPSSRDEGGRAVGPEHLAGDRVGARGGERRAPERRATLTATSGVWAAKLRVPHSGSTSHSRLACGRARCGRPPRRPSRRPAGARPAPRGSPPRTPGRRTSRSRCPPWRGGPAGRRTGSAPRRRRPGLRRRAQLGSRRVGRPAAAT